MEQTEHDFSLIERERDLPPDQDEDPNRDPDNLEDETEDTWPVT